ncbi:MAG TPA: PIN domain nuclease [Solirubrobacteraceae bacterium]|nr:PIN domain nuclease [Solirubrobacteraceae bacterium]
MPTFLADKSALTRRESRPEVRQLLEPLLVAGEIASCGIVDLELLYSARDRATYRAAAQALRGMPRVAVDNVSVERALKVQAMLAERSQHRAVPLPDLLVAACAEHAGLAVLHYDADFDRIAKLTGQRTQWVVPRGSVA